jgi:hypothetical protein
MAPPLSMASSSLALALAEARQKPGDIVKYYSTCASQGARRALSKTLNGAHRDCGLGPCGHFDPGRGPVSAGTGQGQDSRPLARGPGPGAEKCASGRRGFAEVP